MVFIYVESDIIVDFDRFVWVEIRLNKDMWLCVWLYASGEQRQSSPIT